MTLDLGQQAVDKNRFTWLFCQFPVMCHDVAQVLSLRIVKRA